MYLYIIYYILYIQRIFTYINYPMILDPTIMIVLLRHLSAFTVTDPVKIVHCFSLIQWTDPLNSS